MKIMVRYEPRKEVVIHEYTRYDSSEEMINALTGGIPPGSVLNVLKWANGVLLSFSAMPINEVTTKELLEGRLHWDHVSFAPMSEYVNQISTPTGVTLVIARVSNNPVFAAIAEFIHDGFLISLTPKKEKKYRLAPGAKGYRPSRKTVDKSEK